MKKKKYIRIFLWAFAAFWLILIFIFSAQGKNLSNSISYGVSGTIVRIIRPDFDSLVDGEQAYQLWRVNVQLRKLAHFFLYTILGILLRFVVSRIKWPDIPQLGTALLLGLTLAALDEVHQYFVPGRSALVRDVVIDFAGILLGCFIFWLFRYLRKRRREKSAAEL